MQLDQTGAALANARVLQARECLESSERDLAANSFKAAANRSYYCIFHSMRAILAFEEFDSKKHSGVISAFRQRYIKTEVFPVLFSDIVAKAFKVRNDSDYQDFYVISKDDVAVQIENAKTFLTAVEEYVNAKCREVNT